MNIDELVAIDTHVHAEVSCCEPPDLFGKEFDDAADWYDQRRRGRGAAFTAAVRQVLTQIAAAPDSYPLVHMDIREAAVPGYPYAVYYRVDPSQITVLAVYHTSRDPSGWQSRS